MKLNDTTRKKPCAKCPYKLGQMQTVKNPCPECRLNGYQSYEWFRKQLAGEHRDMMQTLEKGLQMYVEQNEKSADGQDGRQP